MLLYPLCVDIAGLEGFCIEHLQVKRNRSMHAFNNKLGKRATTTGQRFFARSTVNNQFGNQAES